jgi:hypothetical protein
MASASLSARRASHLGGGGVARQAHGGDGIREVDHREQPPRVRERERADGDGHAVAQARQPVGREAPALEPVAPEPRERAAIRRHRDVRRAHEAGGRPPQRLVALELEEVIDELAQAPLVVAGERVELHPHARRASLRPPLSASMTWTTWPASASAGAPSGARNCMRTVLPGSGASGVRINTPPSEMSSRVSSSTSPRAFTTPTAQDTR